jgi:hypothetical protein
MSHQQDLIQILLKGQARQTVDDVIIWAGDNPAKFKIIVEVISGNLDQNLKDRAAWAMSYIVCGHPELLKYHWDTFVNLLLNKKTSSPIKRNLVRFMQEINIPEKFHGKITDRCFELVNDPKEDIAIRAFAMTILGNLISQYPEMSNELRISIEELLPHASAGLKNRAGKILARIEKIQG